MKRIVAGILAHVDAGKTTLSEALLYATGQVRKLCCKKIRGDQLCAVRLRRRNRDLRSRKRVENMVRFPGDRGSDYIDDR